MRKKRVFSASPSAKLSFPRRRRAESRIFPVSPLPGALFDDGRMRNRAFFRCLGAAFRVSPLGGARFRLLSASRRDPAVLRRRFLASPAQFRVSWGALALPCPCRPPAGADFEAPAGIQRVSALPRQARGPSLRLFTRVHGTCCAVFLVSPADFHVVPSAFALLSPWRPPKNAVFLAPRVLEGGG